MMFERNFHKPKQGSWISLILVLATTVSLGAPVPLAYGARPAPSVDGIIYNASQKSLQIKSSGPITASVNSISVQGNKRIILDIENAEIGLSMPRDAVLLKDLSSRWPAVRNVSVNQFGGSSPVVRVLLDLQGDDYTPSISQGASNQLEVFLKPAQLPTVASSGRGEGHSASSPLPSVYSPESYQSALRRIEDQNQRLLQMQQKLDQMNRQLTSQSGGVTGGYNPSGYSMDDLKRTIFTLNQKYEDLSRENQRLRQKLESQSTSTITGQVDLRRLRADNEGLQAQLSKVSRENNDLKLKLQTAESTPAQPTGEMVVLNGRLETARKELENSIETINRQSLEIKNLKENMQRLQTDIGSSAKDQITLLNTKLEEKEAELKALNRQISQGAQNQTASSEVERKYQTQLKSLETIHRDEVENLKKELAQQDAMMEALSKQLEGLKKNKDTIEAQQSVAKADPAAEELKETLVRMNQKYEAMKRERDTLQLSVQTLQEQKKGSTEALSQLQREFDSLRTQMNELKSNQSSVGTDADKKYLAQIETLETHHQKEMEQLKKELEHQDKLLDELNTQLEKAKKSPPPEANALVQDLQKSLEQQKTQLASVVKERDALKAAASKATATPVPASTVTASKDELAALRHENQGLLTQFQDLQKSLNQQKAQLANVVKERDALKAAAAKTTATPVPASQVTASKDELATLKHENQGLLAQFQDLQKASSLKQEALKKQIQTLEASLNANKPEDIHQHPDYLALVQQKEALSKEKESLAEEKERFIKEKETLIHEADENTGLLNQNSVKLQSATEKIAVLEKELSELKGKPSGDIHQHPDFLAVVKDKEALSQKIQKESGILTETSAKLQTATDKIAALEKEITGLNAKVPGDIHQQPDYTALVKEKEALNLEIQKESGLLTESNAKLQTATDKITSLEKEITGLKAKNTEISAQIAKTKAPAASEKSARVAELEKEIASLQVENQSLLALSQQNASKDKELADSAELVRKQNAQILSLKEQVVKAQETVPEKPSKADTRKLEAQIKELETRHQKEVARLQEELKAQTANAGELTALTQQLEAMKAEKQKLEAALQERPEPAAPGAEDVKKLKEANAKLEKDLSELARKYQTAMNDSDQYRNQLKSMALKVNGDAGKPDAKTDHDLQVALAQIKELQSKLAQARETSQKVAKAGSSKDSAGMMAMGTTDHLEAENHYTSGKDLEKAGKLDDAAKAYAQAVSLSPNAAKYVFALSGLQISQHRYTEAEKTIQEFIDRDPANRDAYNQLGKAFLLDGKVDEANRAFASAIPSNTLSNYATSLKKLGKMDEAEKILKLALQITPDDSDLLFNLGNLYNTINNLESARSAYTESLRVKPEFAEAHYNLGLVYSKLGEKQNAVNHLEKFLMLSPNSGNRGAIESYIKKLRG